MREDDIQQFLEGVKDLCAKHNVFVRIETIHMPENIEAVSSNVRVDADGIYVPTAPRSYKAIKQRIHSMYQEGKTAVEIVEGIKDEFRDLQEADRYLKPIVESTIQQYEHNCP